MSNLFLRIAVRTWFTLTSRDQASTQIQKLCDRYLALAALIDAEGGLLVVPVPKMLGVDEDMRNWSFFNILEHNAIVNRSFTSIIESLVRGEEPEGAGASLRDSPTKHHPVFGTLNAHQWHCMFGFHLFIHYKQAKYIISKITEK
jgi:hypothetical protein